MLVIEFELDFIKIDSVPAVQERNHKLEIFMRKGSMMTRSGCVGIIRDTIAAVISERLVD
jgi:hypothetical protein